MKIKKITIDNSKVVDTNFNPHEETQVRVVECELMELGVGVRVQIGNEIIFVSKEFVDYFAERLK